MKLLKFFAQWCAPCKALERVMEANNIPHDNIDIETEEGDTLSRKYGVRAVPTLVLIDEDGNEINKHVGMMNAQQLKEFTNKANV